MTGNPVRIQLSRRKGWRMPENTVRVSRPGKWGNPFNFKASEHCWTALSFGCRGDAAGRQAASVIAFREWITPHDGKRLVSWEQQVGIETKGGKFIGIAPRIVAGEPPTIEEVRAELRGKNLACWCPLPEPGQPGQCHAAVLLELANAP